MLFTALGDWTVLLPQTKFIGAADVNDGVDISATIALKLPNKNEWIIGIKEAGYLKLVKLRVIGPTSFEWLSTKSIDYEDSSYDSSCHQSPSTFTDSNFGFTILSKENPFFSARLFKLDGLKTNSSKFSQSFCV